MKTIQHILEITRERHLNKLTEHDSQETTGNLTANNGIHLEEGSILSSVIMTLFAFIVFRCLFNKQKKKSVYVIKSKLWLDEDGQRVAISISMPVSPSDETIPLCDTSRSRETGEIVGNTNHIAGGDLWMLLMSEDVPPMDKKTREKKRNKIRHKKTPLL